MKILVIRLSAMGDVAMSVPVFKTLSEQHSNDDFYLITNKLFNPFFSDIRNLTLINPDLKEKHKGIKGLFQLYKKIKKEINPDIVVDIHDVLRTKIIRFFFRLSGTKSVKINKGRKEKRQLTRRKNKILKPLKHTVTRYKEAFLKAGISIELHPYSVPEFKVNSFELKKLLHGNNKKIGIAPFAKHPQKQYPINKTEALIQKLTDENYKIFLFGGGKKEKHIAEYIAEKNPDVTSLVGKFPLEEEIAFINQLDAMITPDSGNMHIAALTSVKIISIWGATHPFAGFTPYIPDEQFHIIQNNNLSCRPCSVFGNKPCYKNTIECLQLIDSEEIIKICKKITD